MEEEEEEEASLDLSSLDLEEGMLICLPNQQG